MSAAYDHSIAANLNNPAELQPWHCPPANFFVLLPQHHTKFTWQDCSIDVAQHLQTCHTYSLCWQVSATGDVRALYCAPSNAQALCTVRLQVQMQPQRALPPAVQVPSDRPKMLGTLLCLWCCLILLLPCCAHAKGGMIWRRLLVAGWCLLLLHCAVRLIVIHWTFCIGYCCSLALDSP